MKRISMATPVFNGNEKKYLNECIDTGWVSANGKFITEFEEKFAEYCGVKYAVTCANGTVSLHLILKALGVKEGDEVIMPTLTYIATANSTRYCGATPVFVDSDENTYNIDVAKIEEKITERTKAIIPVHLYGLPADMKEINELARKYNLKVVEDTAEAHGAEIDGQRTGSFGVANSFSFFGNKIITTGEGGIITTNNKELYKYMKFLRGQGVSADKRYWHSEVGFNYRMTNMQAALGVGQLEKIEWHLSERKRVHDLYKKFLGKLEGEFIAFQGNPRDYKHSYWMTCITLTDKVLKHRDQVMQEMESKGIEMRPLFYPMHVMPPYFDADGYYPVAEKLSERGICLPSHALLTEEDVKYVVETLEEIVVD